MARLEGAIKIVRLLWAQNFVSFRGGYFNPDSANIYDKPSVPIQVYLASMGVVVTRMAGRLADGLLCPRTSLWAPNT